jgi:uncharacterized membrane protein YfcA
MTDILTFVLVGFLAQLVDGALGLAYGIISMTVLLGMGVPPVAASASIHTAEIFTTGVSGLSHIMFKNVNFQLFKRLIIPGIIGSIVGALVLTKVPAKTIKPFICAYLFIMGMIILYKALRETHWMQKVRSMIDKALERDKPSHHLYRVIPLGLAGGFCDAIGGGGWGGMVSSTLMAQDESDPNYTIGTTNLAEFLIALSSSIIFFTAIGITNWRIIVGLVLGGVIAAPLAAFAVKYLPAKIVMTLVGLLVMSLSVYIVIQTFFLK